MFERILKFFKRKGKNEDKKEASNSRDTAKERLHLVLMQDRANVSADFLELMKQEIIEVIKKYIEIDEGAIDVRLTNKENEDGTNGAPALYANIPILNIKHDMKKTVNNDDKNENQKESKIENEKMENKDIGQKKDKREEKNSDKNENVNNKEKSDNKVKEKAEKPKEQENYKNSKEENLSEVNETEDIISEEIDSNDEKKEVKSEK